MNETLNAVFERYSCRAFTDTKLEDSQLEVIAKAAVASPSAMNAQPWHVTVVTDKTLIEEMDAVGMAAIEKDNPGVYERMKNRGGNLFYNAPCMIYISIKKGTELDCGIVCQNIVLAAQSMGINSLICGMARVPMTSDSAEEFSKRMKLPEDYEFGVAVLLGYEVNPGKPHEPDLSKITYIK